MKSWTQKMSERVKRLYDEIGELKEDMEDHTKLAMSDIVWDVAEFLYNSPEFVIITSEYNELTFFVSKKISAEYFDECLDVIENKFKRWGYFMDLDYHPHDTGYVQIKYRFLHDSLPAIKIGIGSTICKVVETGRMLPETKKDCDFIE